MNQNADNRFFIAPEQLCVGLYVHLDMSWMHHPFSFNSFRISSPEQVATLRGLGLKRIRFDPDKSSARPLPAKPAHTEATDTVPPEPVESPLTLEKRARIEQLARIRRDLSNVEKKFRQASATMRNIGRNLLSSPQETVRQAEELADEMVTAMLADTTVLMHALDSKLGEDSYFHALNVAVLALMLAKQLGLSAQESKALCMGAMFHDIGKLDIPSKILLKTEPLTKAEQSFLEQHCDYGVKLAAKVGLTGTVSEIIGQHHELADGSGYPRGLAGDRVSTLVKIVAMVNLYDNLCNPVNLANAITPHEALSQMFAVKRGRFDETLLKLFIRSLGVYPPGSIVQLSNEMIGLVLYVDTARPLRPTVLIYDPSIPKEEAMILDLGEMPDLAITKGLRPGHLPREVYQYLSPRQHVTYYFDPQSQSERP